MRRLIGVLAALALTAGIADAAPPRWIGTWAASPTTPAPTSPSFENQTVRQVMRVSAGGRRLRVRLTNEYGTKALAVGSARIALVRPDGTLGESRPLTFSGKTSASIAPAAPLLSDPVDLVVPRLGKVAVSLYLPEATGPCTCHALGVQQVQVSGPGDFTAQAFEPARTITQRPFVSAIEVESDGETIVTFGDSITDGFGSTVGGDARWPDLLARRLAERYPRRAIAVSNAGISGNRVLSDGATITFGQSALARFDRDVASIPGAQWLVVLEGTNDMGAARQTQLTAEQLIAGHRQIIARGRAEGLKVIGATLIPFEGARYHTPEGEAIRAAVNQWIRTGGEYDAVIDFDAAIRDPVSPNRMRADMQVGDWLHPNDAGYRAMAEAIDLRLFR